MNLRTRIKTNGDMIVEQTSSDHAGEFVVECDADKVIAQGLLTASVSASLNDLPLATTGSQGLMSPTYIRAIECNKNCTAHTISTDVYPGSHSNAGSKRNNYINIS